MEPLLKWTITGDITKIYCLKLESKRYSKLIEFTRFFYCAISMIKVSNLNLILLLFMKIF